MTINLQDVLHSEIPLTKAIGISVDDHSDSSLTLSAPLENNINHKCTAFGGSLYSVAVLSGWGLIYLLLNKHNLSGHIVIQESNIKYTKPVTTDITSTCTFSSPQQQNTFIKMFTSKGIARINLEAIIQCNNEEAVLFKGTYVAHT